MEEYGLITFISTQFALQGETILKKENINFKTIPTPRDVSHSCGLSLLFDIDELEKVKELIELKQLDVDQLYKYFKKGHRGTAEKIL